MTANLGELAGAARGNPRRTAAGTPQKNKKLKVKLTRRGKIEARWFWLFISPWLIGFLGFMLGPRINAGGRIGRADLGVRLLLEHDVSEAAKIAAELDRLNTERREIEQMAEAQAEAEALASLGLEDKGAVIVLSEGAEE